MTHAGNIMAAVLLTSVAAAAFGRGDGERTEVTFTCGLESNTIYYVRDDGVPSYVRPTHAVGSNNWLKGDITAGRFSAGLQFEYYPVPLQGYPSELQGIGLPGKYVSWTDRQWSITAGDFYEQFGSGIVFRSWEDRELGINNSIGGARLTFNVLKDALQGRFLFGFPRYYLRSEGMGYPLFRNFLDAYSRTRVAGGDVSLSLLRLAAPSSDHDLTIEGSVVARFENALPSSLAFLASQNGIAVPSGVVSWSARAAWSWSGLTVKAEYAGKSTDLSLDGSLELKNGNAQLVEINYSSGGFSGAVTLRRLSNMQSPMFRSDAGITAGNTLNYLPSLSQQQSYMLASLNPCTTFAEGEAGGQIDLFYNFRRGTKLGGRYGMKLHVNGSMIYGLASALPDRTTARMSYRDITIDLEKRWNPKFKTVFFVSIQENSPTHGNRKRTDAQNVFVVDAQYKFTQRLSLRAELQYLYSEELTRDWMAGLLELSFAPRWSFYVSDMYNHGSTRVHYYSAGIGYSHSFLRVSAGYGRNREGMVCSGGVCRWQPAYTGGNLQLSLSF